RERHIVSIHEQGLLRVGKATTYVADLGCDNAHGGLLELVVITLAGQNRHRSEDEQNADRSFHFQHPAGHRTYHAGLNRQPRDKVSKEAKTNVNHRLYSGLKKLNRLPDIAIQVLDTLSRARCARSATPSEAKTVLTMPAASSSASA